MRRGLRIGVLLLAVLWPLAATAADEGPTGEALFLGRCTGLCHQTPRPEHLTAAQWRAVLDTMQDRMRQFGMPPLTEDEYRKVLDYLTERARR